MGFKEKIQIIFGQYITIFLYCYAFTFPYVTDGYTGLTIIQTSIYGKQNSLLQGETISVKTWRQVRRSITKVFPVFFESSYFWNSACHNF